MRTILITLILFLSLYQDFFTFNYFGEIAKTPIVFLTPFLLIYEFFSIKHGKVLISKYQKIFILYYFLIFIITIIYFLLIYFKFWTFEFLGENVIFKSIKLAVYPLVYFIFYRFIINFLNNSPLNLKKLLNAIYINQLILIVIIILEIPAIKDGISVISNFHPHDYKYWRIRLLTFESSWTGPVGVIFSLTPLFLMAIVKVKKWYQVLITVTSIGFLLLFLLYNGSKGFIVCFVIAILGYVLNFILKKGIKPIYILGFLLFSIIPILNFQHQIVEVSNNFNSKVTGTYGTRFISYFASLKTFIANPFGTGLGGLSSIYPLNIEYFVDMMSDGKLDTQEISGYTKDTSNLSTKTYFFDQLIFGGLLFLMFFYLFFIKRLVWIKKRMFENKYMVYSYVTLFCLILMGITYLTFHIKYEIWLFLAILDFVENKYKNKQNLGINKRKGG